MQNNYIGTLASIQRIDLVNKCLLNEIEVIREENTKLKTFLEEADKLGEVDLKGVVVPADQQSKELVELLSQKKALEAVIPVIESKFKENEINFETFMRLMRKY